MSLFFVNCERTVLFSVKRDLDPPFTTLCTCTPWQIVSQDLLQFTSDNESDRQMAHRHRHTHTLTHLLFIKLSEFSPPHNAGSNSAKCVGKLMVTHFLRSKQARIFSPAPTMEQSKLTFVNYLMQMLMKQPFSFFLH